MTENTIIHGDAFVELRKLADNSVQSCITSPPYYGLRDYGIDGQIGLEESPDAYIAKLVDIFREVRRVLKDDGVLWLNIGDSYAGSGKGYGGIDHGKLGKHANVFLPRPQKTHIAPKNLIGIPWRVAFALQSDGWILRADCIWHKPNAMPESVRDRPTKAHEYLFLLAKNERYYYDADAVREPGKNPQDDIRRIKGDLEKKYSLKSSGNTDVKKFASADEDAIISRVLLGRNRRTVWSIATKPYKGAHFAVMPRALVEPCVLASSRPDDTVLDPFAGAGTVPLVAQSLGRRYIGIELNPAYADMARERLVS